MTITEHIIQPPATIQPLVLSLFQQHLPTARLVLFFVTVVLASKLFLTRKRYVLPVPPGPRGVPFLGYLPFLDKDFHITLTNLATKYGPVYQIFLGNQRIVVINDPKIVREAFRQPVFSGRPNTELTKLLQGYGIINSEGELWKEQRAFLHTVLRRLGAKSMLVGKNGLENKIKAQVDDFLIDLKAHESEPIRIRPMFARAVSNIVGSLLMNMTFDDKEDKEFLRLLELIDEGFKLFTVAMPSQFFPVLKHIPGISYAYHKIKGNRNETSAFFKGIADHHRETLDANNIRDIVDAYLLQQEKLTNEGKQSFFTEAQLIQIMNDLFSAGLETVTSTLEWAVLFLMKYPDVQAKVHQEVMAVIGGHRNPDLDDLPNMPYTEATMYEVLRRSNVIALGNAHAATDDAVLAGFTIPKETQVISNIYAIHMDPNLWDEPEEFNPTRFLKDGKVVKPDFFIPFSVGRRMCLGDVLTKMEVFLFLTSLIQRYELVQNPKEEVVTMNGTIAVSVVPKPFTVNIINRK